MREDAAVRDRGGGPRPDARDHRVVAGVVGVAPARPAGGQVVGHDQLVVAALLLGDGEAVHDHERRPGRRRWADARRASAAAPSSRGRAGGPAAVASRFGPRNCGQGGAGAVGSASGCPAGRGCRSVRRRLRGRACSAGCTGREIGTGGRSAARGSAGVMQRLDGVVGGSGGGSGFAQRESTIGRRSPLTPRMRKSETRRPTASEHRSDHAQSAAAGQAREEGRARGGAASERHDAADRASAASGTAGWLRRGATRRRTEQREVEDDDQSGGPEARGFRHANRG